MKRVVFMNDILFHSPENKPTYHTWIADIMNPAVHCSCNQNIVLFTELINDRGEIFDRNKFYELSNIKNVSVAYYLYDINLISKKSWNYLFSFIKKTDFIIGCELGLDLRKILTNNGYIFINFWFHSFHLFDDICFMLNTNKKDIFSRIKKYQIPKEKFDLYATVIKKRLSSSVENLNLETNSCLFIAQSMKDKSVEKDGTFLNITNFPEEIEKISKKYSKLYYIPHPYCPIESTPKLFNYIKQRPYIEILTGIPTYSLLASDKINGVVGISSSVLYEASFFGKKIQYLYQPLFDIDGDFSDNMYISVYNDYLNPNFWIEIFDGYFSVNKSNKDVELFDKRKSVLRGEILNSYHGYRPLDEYAFLSDKIDKLENRPRFSLRLFEKYKFNGVSKFYILGIPVYKRKNKVVYILGIPVYDKQIHRYLFSKTKDNFYKYLKIFGITFKYKNYSINSGERQTGTTLEEIRKDHYLRYQFVVDNLMSSFFDKKSMGIDLFCGNGYGSYMISKALPKTNLTSYDGCKEAIKLAKKYYKNDNNTFFYKLFPFDLGHDKYDYVISLESIEHVKDDILFVKKISNSLKNNGVLIVSTPNLNKYSLQSNVNHFHYRHYNKTMFIKMMKKYGFELQTWYGQDTYVVDNKNKICGLLPCDKMNLKEKYDGQFIIYVFKKYDIKK